MASGPGMASQNFYNLWGGAKIVYASFYLPVHEYTNNEGQGAIIMHL